MSTCCRHLFVVSIYLFILFLNFYFYSLPCCNIMRAKKRGDQVSSVDSKMCSYLNMFCLNFTSARPSVGTKVRLCLQCIINKVLVAQTISNDISDSSKTCDHSFASMMRSGTSIEVQLSSFSEGNRPSCTTIKHINPCETRFSNQVEMTILADNVTSMKQIFSLCYAQAFLLCLRVS